MTHQVCCHPGPHGIPDDLTRIQILNPGYIQPPFLCRDIGDVGEPGLIRARRGERLRQAILRHWQVMRRIRGDREPLYRCTAQAQLLSQPLDTVDPSWKPILPQFGL